jgi:hypothetical protein
MAPRDVARAINIGRVAIGAGLVLAPGLAARGWVGADADRPAVAVLARALGVRDLVLGAMALHTMDRPEVGPRWLRTLAAVDAVDLAATLAARRALPAHGVVLVAAMASGAAAAQAWAATSAG